MKKKIIYALMIAIMCATPCNAKVVNIPKGIYPSMGVVTNVKERKDGYFRVTFRDGARRKYAWIDDDPTWVKGDFVATIMYDNETRNVYDDQVVDARYVGCKKMF